MDDVQTVSWWDDGCYILPDLALGLPEDLVREPGDFDLPLVDDTDMNDSQFEKYFDYDMFPSSMSSDFDEIDINDLPDIAALGTNVLQNIMDISKGSGMTALTFDAPQSTNDGITPLAPSLTSTEATANKQPPSAIDKTTLRSQSMKWEVMVNVFPSKPDAKVRQQKRKRYTRSRRSEVAKNRAVGACIHCKLRKGSCNFGIPCNHCLKVAGNSILGQALCTRQNLMTARFNNVDLFGIVQYQQLLEDYVEQKPLIAGTKREIYLSWGIAAMAKIPTLQSKFKYKSFRVTPSYYPTNEFKQRIIVRTYNRSTNSIIPDSFCIIAPGSLPSLSDLAHACSDSGHGCASGPFAGVHKAFNEFCELYCAEDAHMPLKGLVEMCFKLKKFLSIWRQIALYNDQPEERNAKYVTSWIQFQLRHHIGKGIVELEYDIFKKMDQLLYGSQSIGRQNPLATWTCLWILLLTYKEHMLYTHVQHIHDNFAMQTIHGLTRHIYNTLTSIYAALYKTTSPLTFDWRFDGEIAEMLGRDPQLIQSFCNIKTEMDWFHGSRDHLLEEDELFKTLVVEREGKLLASHKKEALKKGIL